jgi:3-phenylpropionate/trans-cinnamate dioxygenase ferredoxin reductase subunit
VAPYERPHLSKGFLLGTVARDRLRLRPTEQYRELGVELVLGQRVVDLGLERHAVELDGGGSIAWDRLCIATGSDARRLDGFENALYLRELADAERLQAIIERSSPLDIIGAGFIGCEVAAAARLKGCAVRVHEALEQPLFRVLGADLGGYLAAVHRGHGVDLRLGVKAPPAPSGALLVAVGSEPRLGLAQRAGLQVDRGVVVDSCGRTAVEGVFAAGDVSRFSHPLYETRIRVEHFQTAERQGFATGRAMASVEEPYREVPWFWSDQYDLNLQYVGAGLAWDETVVRGEHGTPPFTVFYLQAGRLVAAAGINDHHTIARARRVMEAGKSVSRQQLADRSFDLKSAALA